MATNHMPGDSENVLQGERQLTNLQQVVGGALERIHEDFVQHLDGLSTFDDATRKFRTLEKLHCWRQSLLRVVSLVQWHPKAKATRPCVEKDSVLDTARKHAQALQSTADDMYHSHQAQVLKSVPMFDVQTALDVLTTGTYTDLPTSITKMGGSPKVDPQQQKWRLRQISHIIHTQLLQDVPGLHTMQADLPPGMEVVSVKDGAVTVTHPGLYTAKLTMKPGLVLQPEPADPAGNAQDGNAGNGKAAVGGDDDDDEVSSGPPKQRWVWLLLEFNIPVTAIKGSALQESQISSLLRYLNDRMDIAADAAHYEAQRRKRAPEQDKQPDALDQAHGNAPAASASVAPSLTAATRASESTAVGGDAGFQRALVRAKKANRRSHVRALGVLAQSEADEVTAPLSIMHVVLSDISARLLVAAAKNVAEQIVGQAGCWFGHASIEPGCSAFEVGFSTSFWTQGASLLPPAPPAPPAPKTTATAAGTTHVPTGGKSLPRATKPEPQASPGSEKHTLEIGISEDGTVQVVYRLPSSTATPVAHQRQAEHFKNRRSMSETTLRASTPNLSETLGGHSNISNIEDTLGMPSTPGTALQGAAPTLSPALPTYEEMRMSLDAASVNIDELLLRAAAALATKELQALHAQLEKDMANTAIPASSWQLRLTTSSTKCIPASAQPLANALTVQQAVSGSPHLPNPANAAHNAHQARSLQQQGITTVDSNNQFEQGVELRVDFPVLEFWSQGELLVRVSRSLFTGRLLLQPGPGLAGDASMQSLGNWSQKEQELNDLLQRLHATPSGGATSNTQAASAAPGGPGSAPHPGNARMVPELSQRLASLLKEQQRSWAVSTCMSAARKLHLHLGGPSTRIVNAFQAENPWADLKRFYTLWSLPPTPFPADMPPLYPCHEATPTAGLPQHLSFVISADHPSNPRASYSLLVVSCTAQMQPLKVLKVIPVPHQAYCSAALSQDEQHDTHLQKPDLRNQPSHELDHIHSHRQQSTGNGLVNGTSSISQQQQQGRVHSEGAPGQGRALPAPCQGDAEHSGRDLLTELTGVVGWCKGRLVWEKLTAQLKALQAVYVEVHVSTPASPAEATTNAQSRHQQQSKSQPAHIRLQSFAGIQVPCKITRRKGEQPQSVGLRRVCILPGSDVTTEQVIMILKGSWFSFTSPAQHAKHTGLPHADLHQVNAARISHNLRAESVQHVAGNTVALSYSLGRQQSVIDMLADLLSIIRTQSFLARMESMCKTGSLTVAGQEARIDSVQETLPAVGVKREAELDLEANFRKKIRSEGLGAGDAPLENGWHDAGANGEDIYGGLFPENNFGLPNSNASDTYLANGNAHHQNHHPQGTSSCLDDAPQQQKKSKAGGMLTWTWPGNTRIALISYSLNHASFTCSPYGTANTQAQHQHQHTHDLHDDTQPDNSALEGLVKAEPQDVTINEHQQQGPIHSRPNLEDSSGVAREGDAGIHDATSMTLNVQWGLRDPVFSQLRRPQGKPPSSAAPGASTPALPSTPGGLSGQNKGAGALGSPQSRSAFENHNQNEQPVRAHQPAAPVLINKAVVCMVTSMSSDTSSRTSNAHRRHRRGSASEQQPLQEFVGALQDMADCGEEGLLLDSLALTALPTQALTAALDRHTLAGSRRDHLSVLSTQSTTPGDAGQSQAVKTEGAAGSSSQSQKQQRQASILHVPGGAPFQYEVIITLPSKAAAVASPAVGVVQQAAQSSLSLQLTFTGSGRSWLHVALTKAPDGHRSAAAFLYTVLKRIQDKLGSKAVYVASAWSQLEAPGSELPKLISSGNLSLMSGPTHTVAATKHLWVLVTNAQLEAALMEVFNACASS